MINQRANIKNQNYKSKSKNGPFTKQQKKSIKGPKECVWCGWKQSFLDAAHLIDEIDNDKSDVNAVYMCKNCHAVFDDVFRPRLFKALHAYGIQESKLPPSWRKCNKLSQSNQTLE
jgi:CRISPR/Cas system-associated protein Cas10 (large subunit of type III CRISPR-Cas system)